MTLGLFEGVGIELEYMIVDRRSLSVRPIADQILYSIAGSYESEVEVGELAWSNELVLHVIEIKTNGPRRSLSGLSTLFHRDILRIDEILEPLGARLMPTAMHPWMQPDSETHLWPHEHSQVYETFNRVFDCRGHGWANVQSVHINLPFSNDDEFGRLHAAIRLVLPLLPALAASSPFVDGKPEGFRDARLDFYRRNCSRVPSVTGLVVPEAIFTRRKYQTELLGRLYRDVRSLDPDGVLEQEWLNARGAIARFERNTIEIRLLDIQECPAADMAVAAAVIGVIRAMVEERWSSYEEQKVWNERPLADILSKTVRDAEQAEICNLDYLRVMGAAATPVTAGELWRHLVTGANRVEEHDQALEFILSRGTLATRLLQTWQLRGMSLQQIYREACECLRDNRLFGQDDV